LYVVCMKKKTDSFFATGKGQEDFTSSPGEFRGKVQKDSTRNFSLGRSYLKQRAQHAPQGRVWGVERGGLPRRREEVERVMDRGK